MRSLPTLRRALLVGLCLAVAVMSCLINPTPPSPHRIDPLADDAGADAGAPWGPMLPPPIPRAQPAISVRVERRWHELLATAQAKGEPAEHCMGSVCLRDGFTIGACPCECEGCALVKDLLAQAKREVGRE